MRIACELKERGFARSSGPDLGIDFDAAGHLAEIRAEFAALERDPYGAQDNRFRRYAKAVLLPWSRHLEWIPARRDGGGREMTDYFQGKFNPEFANVRRTVAAISRRSLDNPLIRHLIWRDYDGIFLDDGLSGAPLAVGLSFIRTSINGGGGQALSTPDYLHQDGELFTFAHLVNRRNAAGGVNTIAVPGAAGRHPAAVPGAQIMAAFELSDTLDTYAIYDPLVSHHVSAIAAKDPTAPAERSVMLIDFTPMVPVHHQ